MKTTVSVPEAVCTVGLRTWIWNHLFFFPKGDKSLFEKLANSPRTTCVFINTRQMIWLLRHWKCTKAKQVITGSNPKQLFNNYVFYNNCYISYKTTNTIKQEGFWIMSAHYGQFQIHIDGQHRNWQCFILSVIFLKGRILNLKLFISSLLSLCTLAKCTVPEFILQAGVGN